MRVRARGFPTNRVRGLSPIRLVNKLEQLEKLTLNPDVDRLGLGRENEVPGEG